MTWKTRIQRSVLALGVFVTLAAAGGADWGDFLSRFWGWF